jgi:hypothetical protein
MNTLLTVLLVLNAHWSTLPAQIQTVEATFPVKISYLETNFTGVPFTYYPENQQTRVDTGWMDQNVIPLATSSDEILLLLEPDEWKSPGYGGFTHTDRNIITAEATEDFYFYEIATHEISHKLYSMYGIPDRTHQLVTHFGYGKWQKYAAQEFYREKRKTILALADFMIREYNLGNMENVEWAANQLLSYVK